MKFKGTRVPVRSKKEARMKSLAEKGNLGNLPDKSGGFQESRIISCGTQSMRRLSPHCSSSLRTKGGRIQKRKATEDGTNMPMVPLEKVDAVSYPREILGGKNMHASFGINDHCSHDLVRKDAVNDSDADASSVGSCSVVDDGLNRLSDRNLACPYQEANTLSSDAESFHGRDEEEEGIFPFPHEEDVAIRIHNLELHAYRRILVALYVSGPMSWEQESLLTNLRLSLNISNDEHLIELKNLISSRRSVLFR